MTSRCLRYIFTFRQALALLVGVPLAAFQISDETSASELIRSITHQSDGLVNEYVQFAVSPCWLGGAKDRLAALALLQLGPRALASLDDALRSMESEGADSHFFLNSSLVLAVYAETMKELAVPRLKQMMGNPKLKDYWGPLEDAMAIALSVTSYVSPHHAPPYGDYAEGDHFYCEPGQPQDALDQVIFAMETQNASLIRRSLGANAAKEIDRLLASGQWRRRYGERPAGPTGAVAYTFDVPGRWSEPNAKIRWSRETATPIRNANLSTRFKDKDGRECGTYQVRFVREDRVRIEPGLDAYKVDNVDFEGLAKVISSCASR
jgi:hypothetical protein